ncbi:MAG: PAS domain S-box protein [Rubrobacter sp.]
MSKGTTPGRSLRLLLVEDSENDAMLLLRELRRGGYEPLVQRVFTPEEMEEALGEAGERGETFDVVISDYHMPRFRAPDALTLLRGLGYDTPFIVVSGKIGEDAAVGILKAGADDYLTKENMSRLCPAIERELGEAEVRRERARAKEALSRSEERFRRLVEQIPAVTYVQEPIESENPKAITYMSPQYQDMLGYSRESGVIDEEHWLGTLHPADRERVLAEELRTDESGEPYRMEYRQIARDGRVVWVRDQATLVRDEGGRPLYWLGVQYDVTEQKRIEAELRQGEQRYRTFIEQSTEGIWRFELEEPLSLDAAYEEQIEHIYRHTYLAECNDAMARMYGYERAEELVGARLADLLPRSEPENVGYLRAFMISGYSLTDAESREFDRQGNPKVFLNNLTGIVEDGFLVRAWGTQRDVTEQKEAEEALRESEDRFRLLADEAVAGIVLIENGAIFDANKSFTRMFGYELGELAGMRATEFVVPEDREEVVRRISSGDTEAYEIRGLRKDGTTFPIELRPRQLPYRGRRVRLTSIIDLTERKRAEQALREAENRYRTLVERVPAVIYVDAVDEEGSTTYISPQIEALLGYSPQDYVSDPGHWKTVIHPEDRERVLSEHARATATGEPFGMEYRFVARDGRIVWVRDEAVLMRDEAGSPSFWQGIQTDITERKSIEEALQISEERFRTIVEQSPLSIQILAPDGRTVQVNRAWEELWGVTLDDIAGYNILEDRQLAEKGLMPYLRMGFAGERALIPPTLYDPQETIPDLTSNEEPGRWVRAFIYPLEDEAGNIREVILMHEDITERRLAEEALEHSEERFRATFEQAAVGMAQVSLDGRWLMVNQKLCEIVGYSAEEMDGLAFQDITHPADLESDLEHVRLLLAREIETYSMEKRYFRKDGSIVWIDLTVSLVRGATGEARYFVSVIEDISERKRTEEALEQSEELYRTVVEQAAENIYLVDGQTRLILESNAALQNSLGYTAEDLKGMTLYDIVASDRNSVDQNIERIVEEGTSFLGERQYRRRDGALVDVEVSVCAIPYRGRDVMCVVAHDVSERKRAERALEEIREAERNRIARELHDSTLQDIVYALQEIQIVQVASDGGQDPALEDSAEALRRSVEGLRGAIFELRLEDTLGRSFASTLENLIDLNRRMSRGRYELDLIIDDGFPSRVSAKTGRELARIVQEALTNVRRHAEARHARVELSLEGEVACVEVSDDGRGFAPGSQKAGVGRHSMQARALEIGGELWIASEPGGGTRVTCRVPVSLLIQDSEQATPSGSEVSPSTFGLD